MSIKKSQKWDDFSTLAARLRFVRTQAGLSIDQLAERVGIPKSTIHNAEKGMDIKTENLKRIIRQLGIDATWMLFGEGEPAQSDLDEVLGRAKMVLRGPNHALKAALEANIYAFSDSLEQQENLTREVADLKLEVQKLAGPNPPKGEVGIDRAM